MGKVIGIDLGTTNSCVAVMDGSEARVIENAEGARTTPSMVAFVDEEERLIGQSAKRQAVTNPENTLFAIKRLIGRRNSDKVTKDFAKLVPYDLVAAKNGDAWVKVKDEDYSPSQISGFVLRKLKEDAEAFLGESVTQAVITVPAYFNDAQRQATKDAATLAGIKVLRLLNEPTAAAIAYGLDEEILQSETQQRFIAVYDLGGGTFDISILRLSKGVFEVLATGGDSALGGDDFDHSIANWLRTELDLGDTLDIYEQRILLEAAKSAKEELSQNNQVELDILESSLILTRETMHQLIDELIEQTIKACKRSMRDAGIKASSIDEVVLVGGSTRMPRVSEKVAELFGIEPKCTIDPDLVVAMGAAKQADILVGNNSTEDMLLLDVIPLSLGIETMGGLSEKIIHRNTTIPVAKAQEFTTFKDGQTAMSIHVVQGDRELVTDCRSLARFELRGIPPMVAGSAKIQVSYQVDADGLLNVSARELSSGVESRIEVKPSYGLSDNEITQMLQDSFSHARDDMRLRALREQQVEADRMLEDLRAAIEKDGQSLLDESELQCLQIALDELNQLRDSTDDHRQLAAQIEVVGKTSEEFAARRMDASIKQALAGLSLDDALK